jgi:prepilin peptidase CpaA
LENIILIIVLFICLITDIKSRKILNIITLPTIVFGLVFYIFSSGFEGFLYSGKGFLVGLILLLIPYLLGGMGAGDVKLMAAIGALMGTSFVFYSFIYTALFGGVISILLFFKTYGFINTMKSLFINIKSFFFIIFFRNNLGLIVFSKEKKSRVEFPYGVAIVLGTFCTLLWGGF